MVAYVVVVRDEMKDAALFAAYQQKVGASFADRDLKVVIANGPVTPLEGKAPDGVVVLEFPSVEAAKAWYFSPEYQAAVGERLAATTGLAVIVEGYRPD